MVTNGTTECTVVKARFLNDIRKTILRHNHDVTFNDLLLMLQRIFCISPSLPIIVKYRDSDGDFVTLTDDNDLILALQSESSLFVQVSVSHDGENDTEEIAKSLASIQSSLDSLSSKFAALSAKSQAINRKAVDKESPEPSPLSPVTPATIQPSIQQQVADGRSDHVSTASLEDEIHLGGEAGEELGRYAPPSIPSFPQATAPPSNDRPPSNSSQWNQAASQAPPPSNSTPQWNQTAPQPPPSCLPQKSREANNPLVPSYPIERSSSPPTSIAQTPLSQYPPPPSAAPSLLTPQSGAAYSAPPTQFGGPPCSQHAAPPSQTGVPPTSQFAPPSSQTQFPGAPSQFGVAPPSQFGGAPPQYVGPSPPQFGGAPSSQYGNGPPSHFGGPHPSQFAPPPSFAPPVAGVPGANPFARPAAEYRQSPYQNQ